MRRAAAISLAAVGAILASATIFSADEPGRTGARRFSFSGFEWSVKTSEVPTAPQDNRFGPFGSSVFLNAAGELVLTIRQGGDGVWRSSEVILGRSLGYGTYRIRTRTRLDSLDRAVVAGFFTWDTRGGEHHREIDIEFSRWGDEAARENAQFVVQPYDEPGNLHRFRIEQEGDLTSHELSWSPGAVAFASWHGHGAAPPSGSPLLISRWERRGVAVPEAGKERIRMNLYLYRGLTPRSDGPVEFVVSSFEFAPRPPRSTTP